MALYNTQAYHDLMISREQSASLRRTDRLLVLEKQQPLEEALAKYSRGPLSRRLPGNLREPRSRRRRDGLRSYRADCASVRGERIGRSQLRRAGSTALRRLQSRCIKLVCICRKRQDGVGAPRRDEQGRHALPGQRRGCQRVLHRREPRGAAWARVAPDWERWDWPTHSSK